MRREIDDDEEIKDRLRVPMLLMDARNHQPHHAELTDEVRKLRTTARTQYLSDLTSAWSRPSRDAAPDVGGVAERLLRNHLADPHAAAGVEKERRLVTAEDVEARRRQQHQQFAEQLSNAWRGGR